MRRLYALAAAVMFVVLAAGALAAIKPEVSSAIVCPQQSTGHSAPCCGPPLAAALPCCAPSATPCCSSAGPCTAAITIASSSDPSTAGHAVTITGRLLSGIAGVPVVLWQRLPGAPYKQIAQTNTATAGSYKFLRAGVQTNRDWYVTAAGASSRVLAQRVKAAVTVSASGHSTATLRGRVLPSHAGRRVLVEQAIGSHWRVLARPRLSPSSRYEAILVFHAARTIKLRILVPASNLNASSSSRVVRLKT